MRNPFPPALLVLFALIFIAGYFTGGVVQAVVQKNEYVRYHK